MIRFADPIRFAPPLQGEAGPRAEGRGLRALKTLKHLPDCPLRQLEDSHMQDVLPSALGPRLSAIPEVLK
ncbi:hypothetical protein GCM10008938_30500 [Deinococcus roseus]|uniref:Uncharacterized protein n=1 Tax=Deinococcus roseus TaxID=392414 RepID=A0ABQ2D1T2_9DEIO|nr:hypothetical protein GCM10008938_30500 [Deinococcus roseus]